MKPNTPQSKNTNHFPPQVKIAALIYAGGRGERMGGVDKALIMSNGKMLVEIVSQHLRLECEQVYISRQKDQVDLSHYGTVLIDKDDDQGPLAGLVTTCMRAKKDGFDYLITAPVDTDVLPESIGKRLYDVRNPHAVAALEGELQPTISLIDLNEFNKIAHLYKNGARSLKSWVQFWDVGIVDVHQKELENHNA